VQNGKTEIVALRIQRRNYRNQNNGRTLT